MDKDIKGILDMVKRCDIGRIGVLNEEREWGRSNI